MRKFNSIKPKSSPRRGGAAGGGVKTFVKPNSEFENKVKRSPWYWYSIQNLKY